MKLISLLSFSTSFYILMNILPFQIQATTNSRPSTSCLDWPLPISLVITTLLTLALAIGLTTVSPRDWSPILHLFIGATYVTAVNFIPRILFSLHCLTTRPMTPCSLSLLQFPAFWLVLKSCGQTTKRHWDSWPLEEKNSIRGQRRGLISQSFCVIVLLKYKGDRESF